MRVFVLVAFSLTLFLLFGCNKQDQQNFDYQEKTVGVKEIFKVTSEQTESSESNLAFSELGRTVVSDEGDIYSVDPWQSIIFRFDDQGNLLNTIGGEGRGPGEFQSIYGILLDLFLHRQSCSIVFLDH